MTIAEFVKQKVPPQQRGIVAMVRKLIRENAPNAKEIIAYDTLGWKRKDVIAVINPTKKYVTLVFLRGAEFKDKYGMLEGTGKIRKIIKIKNADLNTVALRYYIKQAVKFDKK